MNYFLQNARLHAVSCAAVCVFSVFVGACGKPKPTTQPVRRSAVSEAQEPPAARPTDDVFETGAGPGRTHTVQPRETLYGLAQRYYGDKNQWRKIYYANRNRLTDPNNVPAGIRLIIP